MAEQVHKFTAKIVGKISYSLKTPDIDDEKVPGFTLNIEANINQFADPGTFINSLDGNAKTISLKTVDGNIKVNFEAAVGRASIDQRVEFAGEEAIRFIAIPLNISRRNLEDNNGIVALLDLFGEGTAVVSISNKQLGLGLRLNKKADKAAQGDEEEEGKKKPAPITDVPAKAAAGRRPRGFDKSLN